ncbi:MAG: hypothetical protein EOO29_17110 [Comamonadaceae bacterium]|nr:MAG: hypothetical protein EOO29_17110 [Comamonadaceae bacterium]
MNTSASRTFGPIARLQALRLSAAALLGAALLTGCYVVPMQPGQALPPGPVTVVPAVPAGAGAAPGSGAITAPAPATQHFSARLYPSNAEAARYGTLTGVVSNDLNGRGHFSAQIAGESFQGEATRAANSSRSGVANAAGNQGGMLTCRYTMNSSTQGSGSCVLNNGPTFAMHVGG